jgi:hypothetical protein
MLARLRQAPGVLHHIMIRGIERRKIFRDDKDRDNFLERLSILLSLLTGDINATGSFSRTDTNPLCAKRMSI